MDHFIHRFDYRKDTLPKFIDPAHVEAFVRELMQDISPGVAETRRIVELVDFYNVRGLAPDFASMLERKERNDEEYLVSLSLAEALAYVGDEVQRALGRSYFHYLLNQDRAKRHMNALVECYAAYAQEDRGAGIDSRIKEIISELKEREKSDPMAGLQLRTLQDVRNNTLPRIAKAAEYRKEIARIAQTPERLDMLVAIYLNQDTRYREYMERWAIRMILREWENGEGKQIVAAFRRALERIDSKPRSEHAGESPRGSGLRAIEFFGGRLAPEEKEEAKAIPPNLAGMLTLEN
jgi:hypothetical protein